MLKAMARSGVIRVCNKGMSSFGDGSSSSHRENQFKPSSLVLFNWRNWCNNALWWRRQGFYLICFGRGILIESDGGDELGEKNVMGRGKGKKGDVQRRRQRLGERVLTHVLTHS